MNLAIYLLILVGLVTALGTLIPQGQTPSFYFSNYGDPLGTVMTRLSLSNLYQAWWFYLLIFILGAVILICAAQRLRRTRSINSAGSLLFHLAIVFTLMGAAWSLGYARTVQVDIPEQKTVALTDYGFGSGDLTLNSLAIDYYPNYEPRQYTSDLTLSGYRQKDYHQLINVNNPLRVGNLKIYQSTWGWRLKLRMIADGKTQTIELNSYDSYQLGVKDNTSLKAVFLPDLAEDQHGVYSKTPLPNNPHLGLSLFQSGRIVDTAIIAPGSEAQLGPYKLRFDDFSYYSGLLIKYDPGVKLVFTGFILLLLGLITRYWHTFFWPKGD